MSDTNIDPARDLHPQLSVRPEPFAGTVHGLGIRRLSFLQNGPTPAALQTRTISPSDGLVALADASAKAGHCHVPAVVPRLAGNCGTRTDRRGMPDGPGLLVNTGNRYEPEGELR
ncbi:hypothetical protein SMALB_7572 [Streptomyces malaysiensis]|uniref:Uncharacterized protein n=1 Tax=Streptomyces malaysiensis TaxID=92644 RepID=A0A7X5XA63_STRMQ|nr:hypothetical protein [Streptomyces malaysiensis]